MQLDVQGKSENFFVDTYSVLTSCSRALFPQTCTILGATGKTITKDSPEHFFVAAMVNIFWWFLSVLLPYWEGISLCL